MRELGEELQLDPATLSPLLKRLEALGYVGRRRSLEDERVLEITATDAGRALREQAETIPPRIVERLGMSVAELDTLRRSLHKVIAAATI